ncbi:3,5-dihydroxyphenylacetyl-CoA synthase DpgA [Mangrovihabitans endophyticus]|uniref:Polyketide synthase n=1 Tax=Mangrovihabitans endophyticus TaxID=1751298 RepID=A0A8J3C0K5_9ACTN|nr:3,5-dihydroxyphenylacetyl-CoA synthase DpgA [Mangrovihabitans endophyticus]GGK90952.1 polyketide synthase [Mangrovihabitans endophyticus]
MTALRTQPGATATQPGATADRYGAAAAGATAVRAGEPASVKATPQMIGVGSAVTPRSYTQSELLDYFDVTDRRTRLLFHNSAIERRHLTLPPPGPDGRPVAESQGELLRKHAAVATSIGAQALRRCLDDAGLSLSDVDYLCAVTTTGMLAPSLSALLVAELGLRPGIGRLDVVGMGCSAGVSALRTVAGWSAGNPGKVAVMVCAEVCSAIYVFDDSIRTAVVNSLFGDGAAAVAIRTPDRPPPTAGGRPSGPELLTFAGTVLPEHSDSIRFDWDDGVGKYNFYLSPDIPYIVGAHVDDLVDSLLDGTGVRREDIAHWVVHSGGKKVIDSVRVNLGLSRHDLRHTSTTLRDFGNLSSGSFLFAYERLLQERVARPGEYGVMMAMGPGPTIETALIVF